MHKHLFLGLISVTLLAACSQAPQQTAQVSTGALQVPQGANATLNLSALGKNGKLLDKKSKLSSSLRALSESTLSAQTAAPSRPASADRPGSNRLVNGRSVTVSAVASGDPQALLGQLQGLGLQSGAVYEGLVSGRLPIASIGQAGNLSSLRSMRLTGATTEAYKTPSQGLVVSQGDQAQRSDVARQAYRVSGAGVKVGALSDSYNCLKGGLTTAPQDIKNGDLPASGVQVIDELEAASCAAGSSDEGRGMLQIIHDVAPSAQLSFASAFNGEAEFAQNIEKLAQAGANVITDDVRYFDEPMFQDGPIAQAVNNVAKQGVAYFSSSGNYARQSYENPFRPSGQYYNGCQLHDFNPGSAVDTLQDITLAPGDDVLIALQWDQPFASASKGARGSASDVDLLLFDDKGNLLPTDENAGQFPVSADDNISSGDPIEIVQYFNTTKAPLHINLAMTLCTGAQPGILKWVDYDYGTNVEYATNSPTNYGHSNSAGGAGVGAARYYRTPAFGQNPPLLESFSSAGGVPILFDKNGKRIATEQRNQPRFTAPDGGNTSFFGQLTFGDGTPIDGDKFPNFFGTSAAAPHAAGAAALMLEATSKYGGSKKPADIYQALALSAVDMRTPGYDADSGAGLIQADKAISAIIKRAP